MNYQMNEFEKFSLKLEIKVTYLQRDVKLQLFNDDYLEHSFLKKKQF